MATYIKTLKEDNGDITYPQTTTDAVLTTSGTTLETELGKCVKAEEIGSTADITPTITTAMIKDSAVTTTKIADSAVTSAKIDWTTLERTNFANVSISNVNINYQANYKQGSWTCDEAGLYLAYFYQKIQGACSGYDFTVMIYKGTTQRAYSTTPTDWEGCSVCCLLTLSAGDVVYFYSKGGSGSVATADGQAFVVRLSN